MFLFVSVLVLSVQVGTPQIATRGRSPQTSGTSHRDQSHDSSFPRNDPHQMLTKAVQNGIELRQPRLLAPSLLRPKPLIDTMKTIEDMVMMMELEGGQEGEVLLMQELLQLADEINATVTPILTLDEAAMTPSAGTADVMMPDTGLSEAIMNPVTTTATRRPSTAMADIAMTPTVSAVDAVLTPTTTTTTDAVDEVLSPLISTADATVNASAQVFLDRVKNLLAASGIELVLPLDCGRNPLNRTHALGTTDLPWVVALGSRENGRFLYHCAGVIITNFHILTDADCVASPHINVVQAKRSGMVTGAVAAENYVVGRRIHPHIATREDLFSGLNIGILELAKPFLFDDYAQPVCLPGVFEEPRTDALFRTTVAGFSDVLDGDRLVSKYAESNVVAQGAARCFVVIQTDPELSSKLYTLLTKNHLCVFIDFETVGKSVVLVEDGTTGRAKVVGVGGFANARSTIPVAYTLVQPHRFWVELVLKKFMDSTTGRTTG
ncbi:uncharacterized protein [Panulirus ornatus]|uniref:uncharacterized protein isoform X2 n=1 Tax=Panulirus ornatus TaxID=150431 RepID=UPI003A8535B2